jgi:hypothetical protein
MTTFKRALACGGLLAGLLLAVCPVNANGVEMRVSRDAIARTLQQQLFGGLNGRYYLKGSPQTPCYTYAENPQMSFVQGRIVVRIMTHSKLGTKMGGSCWGLSLSVPAEVSLLPDAQGESIGFRDAKLDKISDQKELNFLLNPFLSHQVPSGMKVNAADMLRKALATSTATSGYKVTLDRLNIRSIVVQGDMLVVDVDGDLSVK